MNNVKPALQASIGKLARLWPNREHESNWLKSLCCTFGKHRWYTVALENDGQPIDAQFCRWCTKIKLDGTLIN